jgi:ribosomal-protein-alanine N-acetyltransferase
VNKWRIETVNKTDLEPILAIEQLSFQWPWGRIPFEGELSCQNACNYVVKSAMADNKSQIIAYAFMRRVADELYILKIAVKPARRGHGIATWLLKNCFTNGTRQGVNSVHLEVRPSNIPAVELYEKLGFEEIGRRPNYYTDSKEDALMMLKDLAELRPLRHEGSKNNWSFRANG